LALENHVAHLLSLDGRSVDFGSERFEFFWWFRQALKR
jgi:hypothetical protein